MVRGVKIFLNYSERLLAVACVIAFATMLVLGVATVVFRFIIQSSLAFPDEMIRYLFVWVIALGTAIALRRNMHAAIVFFVDMTPVGLRKVSLLVSSLCSAIFLVIVIINGVGLTIRASHQISPALEISMAWVYSALPIGAVFTLLYVTESFVVQLTQPSDEPALDKPTSSDSERQ